MSTQQNQQTNDIKQGGAIGGWVCFILGIFCMYFSLWSFVIYSPLFFVAFILAIVAMAQGRIGNGLLLLLSTLVIPAVLWFYLAATRTADTAVRTANKLESAARELGYPGYKEFTRTQTPVPHPAPSPSAVSSGSPPQARPIFYSVTGVARGDSLNVRRGPGANNAISARLPNGFHGIRIVGAPTMNGTTKWVQIEFNDGSGWVTSQYLQPERE